MSTLTFRTTATLAVLGIVATLALCVVAIQETQVYELLVLRMPGVWKPCRGH